MTAEDYQAAERARWALGLPTISPWEGRVTVRGPGLTDVFYLKPELFDWITRISAFLDEDTGVFNEADAHEELGEQADRAITAFRLLSELVEAHHAKSGRHLIVLPELTNPPPKRGRRSALTYAEALLEADRIANQLGVPLATATEKRQGARKPESLRAARAIAVGLWHKGASTPVIGRVLGGRSGVAAGVLIEQWYRERHAGLLEAAATLESGARLPAEEPSKPRKRKVNRSKEKNQ
jgi:hypothetical protein